MYIALKAKSPLARVASIKQQALLTQALAVEASSFDVNVGPLIANLVYTPLFSGKPGNAETIKDHAQRLEAKLAAYETILSKQKYLGGDHLTIADIKHLPWGSYLIPQGYTWFEDTTNFPNVARYVQMVRICKSTLTLVRSWWKEISNLESWKETQSFISDHIGEIYAKSLSFKA
jgi:glutathione S-transferase